MDHRNDARAGAAAAALTIRNDVALEALDAAAWDVLAGGRPLVSHAFLSALHASGCASAETGWTPRFLTAWRGGALAGALPLYAKAHSYGEYVFDWSWAEAYHRRGRRYYPKLVAAIPFTPAPGMRALARDSETRDALIRAALALLDRGRDAVHSLHVLFPTQDEAEAWQAAGLTLRHGLQFRWENPGYRDFADFLAAFNHDKRKKAKQDRRRVSEAGVTFRRKVGREIGSSDWAFFFRCYSNTYREHHSTPYLTLEFFERLGETMPGNLLMVQGLRDGTPVCAAFDVFDAQSLWGRYWGTIRPMPGLHFEACYYQAIEFCIERGIAQFEGGAQGVHKLARGLVPTPTWSAHAIADPDFARAIADFCAREEVGVSGAIDELEAASPYRSVEASDG